MFIGPSPSIGVSTGLKRSVRINVSSAIKLVAVNLFKEYCKGLPISRAQKVHSMTINPSVRSPYADRFMRKKNKNRPLYIIFSPKAALLFWEKNRYSDKTDMLNYFFFNFAISLKSAFASVMISFFRISQRQKRPESCPLCLPLKICQYLKKLALNPFTPQRSG